MTWMSTLVFRAALLLFACLPTVSPDEHGSPPSFIQEPGDTMVEAPNISLLCVVKGSEPVYISWQKDGRDLGVRQLTHLSVADDGSLRIVSARRERDEGAYRCLARNSAGTIFSRLATVSFPYMKDFVALDSQITVHEGSRALIACHAPDSYPDRNIYWSKSDQSSVSFPLLSMAGSHFTTSESGDLYFSYVTLSDHGVYFCSVENSNLKRVLKRTVVLSVIPKEKQSNAPPAVWQFEDKVALHGKSFLLECIAYGRPVPKIKLVNSRTGTELVGSVSDGNRARYEFPTFQLHHEGDYECVASNEFGQIDRKKATIFAEAPPEFSTTTATLSTSVDGSVYVPCVAKGIPPVTYEWFFNGLSLAGHSDILTSGGNLSIPKVFKEHAGMYQCVARNRHGEIIMTMRLDVAQIPAGFGPSSLEPALTTHALIGGEAQINCAPTGAPKPHIRWRKKLTGLELQNVPRFTVTPSGTLVISNIEESDAGIYQCIASNQHGTATREGMLVVTAGVAITGPLSPRQKYVIGETIQLVCSVTSASQVEVLILWYIGFRRLVPSERILIRSDGPRKSVLEIRDARQTDTGNYECTAQGTKLKIDRMQQYVIVAGPNDFEVPEIATEPAPVTYVPGSTKTGVKAPPDPPVDVTVSEQDGTKVKISWTMGRDNRSPAVRVYVQARTVYEPDTWFELFVSNDTRTRASEYVQLSPWAEYKFRVLAENGVGISSPSVETESWTRTPPDRPFKFPDEIYATGSGPAELLISWEPLRKIDQNGPNARYFVYYRQKTVNGPFTRREVESGKSSYLLRARNDEFYTEYEFQVQAANDMGYGPLSPIYTAFSGGRIPLGMPTDLLVNITSSTTAVASWRDINKTRSVIRGEFLGYKLMFWIVGTSETIVKESFVTSKTNSVTVGLSPFSSYMFQVFAYNREGYGPGSNVVGPMTTPEDIPGRPRNFMLTDAWQGTALLSWSPPFSPNGLLTGYSLVYTSGNSSRLYELKLGSTASDARVDGLDRFAVYLFSLAASTRIGQGPSTDVTIDFSKLPKLAPSTPVAAFLGSEHVVLTWLPTEEKDISGYKVFFWSAAENDAKTVELWERKDHVVTTIRNLLPETIYNFQTAATNEYGTGPKSDTLTVKLKAKGEANTSSTDVPSPGESAHPARSCLPYIIALMLSAVFVLR